MERPLETLPEDSVAHLLSDWRRERPDLDTWSIAILARVLRLSAQLTQRSSAWLDELGLTWEAFSLIVTLRRQGAPYALRPTDILRESLLTSGAVTNRIDRVVKLGLAERIPDPDDRRAIIVRLTADGVVRADQAIAAHIAHLEAVLGELDPPERGQLAGRLGRALQIVESEG